MEAELSLMKIYLHKQLKMVFFLGGTTVASTIDADIQKKNL